MPDTVIQPPIPTTPVTRRSCEAARHRGRQGLIVDEQDKKPFVTDWRGSRRARLGRGAAGQRRGDVEGREALLRQRHRHRAAGRATPA
jgi:hypothetical protein